MDTPAGATPFPHLRLVGSPRSPSHLKKGLSDPRSPLAALERVAAENRRAAQLAAGTAGDDPAEALRVLALRAAECLDGGHAAILRPERRRRLLHIANVLGVGQFDANLVIAIVQDNARRGVVNADATDPRLAILSRRDSSPPAGLSPAWIAAHLVIAGALGAGLLYALIHWIGG
jgi:hypothetical protein